MRFLPVLALASLLLFSGCLDVLFVDPNAPANAAVACEAFSDLASKDSCFVDRAAKEKNGTICLNVSPVNRDACIGKVADAKKDGVVCLGMSNFDAQILCVNAHPEFLSVENACDPFSGAEKEACSRHAARVLKNEVYCYDAGAQKNECFIDVAKAVNNPDVCELIGSSDTKEACYIATAVNAKNSTACEKIVALDARESCLNGVAVAQANAKICDSISTPSIRASCLAQVQNVVNDTGSCASMTDIAKRDTCFRALATSTKQVDTCTKIIGQPIRNECYSILGQSIGDPAICGNIIGDDAKKQACLVGIAKSGGTAQSCYVLKSPSRDACISDIAVKIKDAGICHQITATTNLLNYQENCLAKVAAATGNPDTCQGIATPAARDACLSGVGIAAKNDLACALISDLSGREACYTAIALALQKGAVCKSIATKTIQDACIKQVAVKTKNAAICGDITDTLAQDECYSAVSVVLKDKSICDKIVNKSIKDPCIVTIAEALNDWQYCLKVSAVNPTLEQSCLSFVADKIGSVEPCTHIPAQEEKGLCYGKAGIASADFSVCGTIPLKPVPNAVDAHFARDTCWNYVAITGHGVDLCGNIYDPALKAGCHG